MKNKLLLLLLLLSAWGARAQTVTLAQESFETDGEGVRYTSNAFDLRTSAASVAGAFPYFTRALTNPFVNPLNPAYVSFGTNAYPVTIGNVTGRVFWAAEAVESTATTPAATDRPPGVVTLYPINASNYSGLTMTVALADARGPSSPTITQGGLNPQNEANDLIRLQYSTDGGATYNTIGQFLGNNATGTGQGYMQRDLNLDGVITSADGAQSATNTLDINLRDFSFSIPGSPAALLVRVQIDQRGASEELAFDNIRVTGVQSTVAPPALANIESTALSYLEGQPATQITNSLTVTNAVGNLTGATVTISSGRAATQDLLVFVNQNGITGSFNTGTGVLTLSGTASAATYQAALRSIAYQNTNSANATAGTRTIQFVVANGSTTSGVVSRNVVVTSALNAATALPYREDFSTDGEGTRYASNTFSLSTTGAAWLRTSANPYQTAATSQTPTTFSGISSSFYWYGNNTNSTANPSRVGTLQTLPINTAGYSNLNFSLLLGASSGANASWQTADYFRVSYRQAGTNTWIPLIQFRGNSTVVAGQGNLQRDADPAATASSPVPTGTTLTPALASFNAYLPVSVYGQTLEFQLVLVADDIRAELAFDNLQLTGTQLVLPTVTTAAASSLTSTSAVLGGNVTNDGGAAVTNRGVVYSSTATTPTIGDAGVTRDANGTGTGSYSKTIAGLTPGTTYYVRAYAQNTVGTSYGTVVSFTTAATAATVTTAAPASITGTSAVLGGSVTADGGAAVTDRGVVYSTTSATPTISDTKVPIGTGTGTFSQTITGLRGNTTYYVRAYATNSAGTVYGAAQTFTTPNHPPTAISDAVTVAEDSGPTGLLVLANDNTLPDVGEILTITSSTQPANGTVTISNTGTFVNFTPALNFNGTTTFTYTVSDGNGGTATATVTVTVTPVNDAPVVTTTTGSTTFTPGAGAVVIDNGLTVEDVDNTTISSATVRIGGGFVSSQDQLSVTISNGVSGTYTFATGTLELVGTATVAQYQTILRSVTYRNSSAAPNTATRTVSFIANDGSLTSAPATKNITFAATTTVASIVRTGASPTNASTVVYTVTFANAVTGLSTGNFIVSSTNLTGTSVASVSGSGTTYTVTVNTGTLSPGTTGSVQLQLNNSTGISPLVTNTGFTGPAYTIDRTPPVVSGVVDGGVYNSSRTISFNEGTATLNGSPFASGSAVSTEGTYTLLVTDAATNTTTVSFTLDLTAPTVVSLTRLSPTNTIATNQTAVTFRVVFSERVTGVAVGDFSLSTGGVTGSVTAVTGTGTTYDVTISGIAGNGMLYPDLRIGSVADLAGNLNTTGITSGQFYLIDNIAPETTITANPPAVTNRTTVTFSFTETDTNGSGVAGFQASLDGAAFAAVSSPVVLSGLADGAHTFRVRALDAAGNVDATPASYTWTVDTSAPTVAISSTAPTPTGVSPIPFTVTFSESVTGFTANDVVVTNGTISTAITNVGNAYSFSVTPATSGLVTVAVAANVAQDLAGNGNAAAAPFSLTYILPTPAPTVTAISPATGPVGTQVTISGTNLSSATAVRFNGTAASSFVANSATSITAVVAVGTTTGLVTVTTPGGSATSATSFVVRVAPTTVADAYSTPAGVTLTGNVLTNDIGTNPRAILITRPTNGTLVLSPTGSFTYVPNAGFSGADSFTYYACDPNEPLLCGNPATVSITVLRIAPVTVADAYSTLQGVTLTGNVLANDLGTNPRAILITRPTHGTLVLNPNGSFTYVPAAGFTGSDSFTYYACDPNLPLLCGNPATVSITVGGGAPITVADAYSTPQGVTLTGNVLSNDIGTTPVAILITRPTRGTLVLNPDGSFTYQPAAGYTGQDSFTYYACNSGTPLVCGDPATVSITIGAPTNTRTAAYQNSALITAKEQPKPAATAARGAVAALELQLTGSPNPFRDQVQLTFALPTTQAYTLAVYDAQGRLVQQLASGQAEAGQTQQVQVPTHLYAEGLYLVRLTTATGAQLLRLVKQ